MSAHFLASTLDLDALGVATAAQNEAVRLQAEGAALAADQARQQALIAYELAQRAVEVFTSQPIPPYKAGDTWVQGDVIKTCIVTRVDGAFDPEDWVEGAGGEGPPGPPGEDGKSPVLTVVSSSNGNVFKNGQLSTVLTARLFQDYEEIDLDASSYVYLWKKINDDGTEDVGWNLMHMVSTKQLNLTPADVQKRATFRCDIFTLGG